MKRPFLLLAALATALIAAILSANVTYALWSKNLLTATTEVRTYPAQIGTKNLGSDDDIVTAADQTLTVPFTHADAEQLYQAAAQTTDGVVDWVKPFSVVGQTTGTIGFSYTVDLPDRSNSYYGYDLFIYPVASQSECDPQNPPDVASIPHPDAADLAVEPAISSQYGASKVYEQWYCMATHYVPPTYENTVTATSELFDDPASGCNVAGLCRDVIPKPVLRPDYTRTDTWWAGILTDPATEPELKFNFHVTVFEYATQL
jgi:hypothetical protein